MGMFSRLFGGAKTDDNYFVKGAWLSFIYRYNGRGYTGEVKKVREWPKGRNILLQTENGLRTFYVEGIEDLCRVG